MTRAWGEPAEDRRAAAMDPKDHKAWLAHWSASLLRAIADCTENPPTSEDDFRWRWMVNCARLAHSRAVKAYPRLKQKA